MEPYPALVRKRIIELYQQSKSTSQIAELFGLCRSGVRRIKQQWRERGTLVPRPRNPGRKPLLTEELSRRLRDQVAAHPDATRQQIKDALGLRVSLQTLSQWLMGLKLPLKKSRCTPPSRIGRT